MNRYIVTLMVGRHLTLELPARDEQAAEDIASYLYDRFGDRHFSSDAETQIDCLVRSVTEEASQ